MSFIRPQCSTNMASDTMGEATLNVPGTKFIGLDSSYGKLSVVSSKETYWSWKQELTWKMYWQKISTVRPCGFYFGCSKQIESQHGNERTRITSRKEWMKKGLEEDKLCELEYKSNGSWDDMKRECKGLEFPITWRDSQPEAQPYRCLSCSDTCL